MGSFRFTWICSLVSLVLLSAAVLWLESESAGLLGLDRPLSLILVVWLVGLLWTALVVLYERAARRRLLKIERRTAEREATLRTAEAAAHELAQPLTVVMAYAQWLQRGSANAKDSRYYLEQMVSSCHEMSIILRNFYETIRHSRAQAGMTILDEPPSLRDGPGPGEVEEDLEPERAAYADQADPSPSWRRRRTGVPIG